jgi:hypothetical protein
MSWISRYRSGEREAVWTEMATRGDLNEADFASAKLVSTETMQRARVILVELAARLDRSGYVFLNPENAIVPPSRNVADQLAHVEQTIGPIPLALRAFWEEVGSVDFVGAHPDWPLPAYCGMDDFPEPKSTHPKDLLFADPLFVASIDHNRDEYSDSYATRVEEGEIDPEEEPFEFVIGPDAITKANVSGGEQHVAIGRVADPDLRGLYTGPSTFVSYVRGALKNAGFAGFAFRPDLAEREALSRWAAELVRGLDSI